MSTRIRAGQLRHVLTIQTNEADPDSAALGRATPSWDDEVSGVRAAIETLSGSELEQARKIYARATHRVTIRHHGFLNTTQQRFLWGTRALYIGHVNDVDGRGIVQECLCAEDAA